MKTRMVWLLLVAVLMLSPATAVLADDTPFLEWGSRDAIPLREATISADGGQIFLDEDVTLGSGEVWRGDLGVLRGNLEMPEGSVVYGDVFVANGDAHIAGQIDGSLAVINGVLDLKSTAEVRGDVFAMGGSQEVAGRVQGDLSALFGDLQLRSSAIIDGDLLAPPNRITREPGATVRGSEVGGVTLPRLPFFEWGEGRIDVPEFTPPARPVPVVPGENLASSGRTFGHYVGRFVTAVMLGLVFLVIGALIVVVWPRPTRRVADCIAAMPAQSFGLGLLTFLVAAGLEALAAVVLIAIILLAALLIGTVILIPFGLLMLLLSPLVLLPVPLALLAGMILGWVAVAQWTGGKALQLIRIQGGSALGAVVVGLLLTIPVAALLWIIRPLCCAWPFIILLTSVGLGAVFHTRFGRQGCRPSAPPATHMDDGAIDADVLPIDAMDWEAGEPDVGRVEAGG